MSNAANDCVICRVWANLQAEREAVCATLLKRPHHEARNAEARLIKIDHTLDAIMNGDYGTCAQCGGEIEEAILLANADARFCAMCEGRIANMTGH